MALSPKQEERLVKAKLAIAKNADIRIEKYQLNPNKCSNCYCELVYEKRKNKYCSHTCSAMINNVGVVRNIVDGKFSKKKCEQCGNETTNKRFCDRNCFSDFCTKNKFVSIEQDGILKGSPILIKAYLIQLNGHCCSLCGLETWLDQAVPLVLDHINGKPLDNRKDNLRLVCGNCNMQLPTFAGRNVGKGGGRPYRNQRYINGESY